MWALITRSMGPTWSPSGADRTQVGAMLAPWTLLSGGFKVLPRQQGPGRATKNKTWGSSWCRLSHEGWHRRLLWQPPMPPVTTKVVSGRVLVSVYNKIRASVIMSPWGLSGKKTKKQKYTRWRHQMEKFSALLALCVGNSPVTGEFPAQRPVTRSFDAFFDLDWVNSREAGDLRRHRSRYDVFVMILWDRYWRFHCKIFTTSSCVFPWNGTR